MKNAYKRQRRQSSKHGRPSGKSLRNSVRKSSALKKRNSKAQLENAKELQREISTEELMSQNKTSGEEAEQKSISETTLTQQESDNFEEENVTEPESKEDLPEEIIEQPRIVPKRRSLVKRNSRGSGKKMMVEEMRRSWHAHKNQTPKRNSILLKNSGFDLGASQRDNQVYVMSLQNTLKQLVDGGEYLKADLVYKEMKLAKARFSEVLVDNIRREIGKGERLLNESLAQEEHDLQDKFDELRQRILDDFEMQVNNLEISAEEEKQEELNRFNSVEETQREKQFKKSARLLEMEEQIRGLLRSREYVAAETLKHKISKQMDIEVKIFRVREEEKLNLALKAIGQRKNIEMHSVEQRLDSALNELQIAFREQKEALNKRQGTLKRNFKNKEMLKLNRANIVKEHRGAVDKFRTDFLRKQPYKHNRFRKTVLNKENCVTKD